MFIVITLSCGVKFLIIDLFYSNTSTRSRAIYSYVGSDLSSVLCGFLPSPTLLRMK